MARKKKPKKPKKPSVPKRFAEHVPSGAMGKSSPADRVSPYSAGGSPALDLVGAIGSLGGSISGLGGVILELVGEGSVSLGSALDAWQREQDRISNRAWRRPGGMARMGGL